MVELESYGEGQEKWSKVWDSFCSEDAYTEFPSLGKERLKSKIKKVYKIIFCLDMVT